MALAPGKFLVGDALLALPTEQADELCARCERWRNYQHLVHQWSTLGLPTAQIH